MAGCRVGAPCAGRDSIAGRTRTAPETGADLPVNLAWVSCQDYGAGHYGAYRQMIIDDDARPAADRIHFVAHLGVPPALRGLITIDASASGGAAFTENLNLWLRHGANAAGTFAATRNLQQGIKRAAVVAIPKDDPAGMTVTVTGAKPFPLT